MNYLVCGYKMVLVFEGEETNFGIIFTLIAQEEN